MFPIRSDLWFSASTEDGGCTVTVSAGTEIHRAHPVPWLFLFMIVFLSIVVPVCLCSVPVPSLLFRGSPFPCWNWLTFGLKVSDWGPQWGLSLANWSLPTHDRKLMFYKLRQTIYIYIHFIILLYTINGPVH